MPNEPITIVAHDAGGVGGMERQLEVLIAGLAEAGHEVLLVARGCRVAAQSEINWVRIRGPSRPFVLAYPWFFVWGSLALKRHRRGLVHSTGAIVGNRVDVITAHFCHRAYRDKGGLPRVGRQSFAFRLNAGIAAHMSRAAEGWCYRARRVRRLIGVSTGVARELKHWFPEVADRVETVANGVDTDAFRPASPREAQAARETLSLPQDRRIALFVGSEWEGKGLRYALEAVARRPSWNLVVLGRGDRQRYSQLAETLGVARRLTFLEPRAEVLPVYWAADALVLPSAYETFSLVSHEGAACGLPLLVTRVSGVEDLLEEGVSGWFVARDGEDIASRLEALERDPGLRDRMGLAARRATLGYSWEAMVEGYRAIYSALTGVG